MITLFPYANNWSVESPNVLPSLLDESIHIEGQTGATYFERWARAIATTIGRSSVGDIRSILSISSSSSSSRRRSSRRRFFKRPLFFG